MTPQQRLFCVLQGVDVGHVCVCQKPLHVVQAVVYLGLQFNVGFGFREHGHVVKQGFNGSMGAQHLPGFSHGFSEQFGSQFDLVQCAPGLHLEGDF